MSTLYSSVDIANVINDNEIIKRKKGSQMSRELVIVGGDWNEHGGRPSKYVERLTDHINVHLPERDIQWETVARCYNGGHIDKLPDVLAGLVGRDVALCWMPNIHNEHEKLIPNIRQVIGDGVLIQSKNNLKGKYSRHDLFMRMRASQADALIEFVMIEDRIHATILTATCVEVLEPSADINLQAFTIPWLIDKMMNVKHPLKTAEIVVSEEIAAPGHFGYVRKHHIHEGVDLYCEPNTPVHAMASGVIVNIRPFTGPEAGSDWWNPTWGVMIEHHELGAINYGELIPSKSLTVGSWVKAGECIGHATPVLKKDKGRPMCMLHLESYVTETHTFVPEWSLNTPQPYQLLDPTQLIARARRRME